MKIDLAALMKAQGSRRTRVEGPEIQPTKAQQDALARLYMPIVRIWASGARDRVLPAYRLSLGQQSAMDGLIRDRAGDVEVEIEAVSNQAVTAIFTFRRLFQSWADALQLWHMRRFISSLRYATNVDLSAVMMPGDVAETMDDVLARNVALIRDVSDQTRGRISDIVFRGLQNRTPTREVAKEISEAVGMARRRALNIAMDQTQKLSASLDRQRQLQVGMTAFTWVHSGKIHYRPEHKARNGKVFDWNSGVGRSDPPGMAPFCGCKAKGVLEID